MVDYLLSHKIVGVPLGNRVGYLPSCDGDAHVPHVVYELPEDFLGTLCLLFILCIDVYRDWKYFHNAVKLVNVFEWFCGFFCVSSYCRQYAFVLDERTDKLIAV